MGQAQVYAHRPSRAHIGTCERRVLRSLRKDKHRANGSAQERPQPKHEKDHSKVHDQTLPVDSEEIYRLARFGVCRVAAVQVRARKARASCVVCGWDGTEGPEPRQRRQNGGWSSGQGRWERVKSKCKRLYSLVAETETLQMVLQNLYDDAAV